MAQDLILAQLGSIWHLIILMAILMLPACAARQNQVPNNGGRTFKEIRKVYFTGNDTFSRRALCKAIASTPRPLFPPWKRGEPFNRPTLEADLQRLKKYYFDRGFLEAEATVNKVEDDPEHHAVRITIDIVEGQPTRIQTLNLIDIPKELPAEDKILAELALRPQKRLTKAAFNKSQAHLIQLMQNVGYARATVLPRTEADRDTHQARG